MLSYTKEVNLRTSTENHLLRLFSSLVVTLSDLAACVKTCPSIGDTLSK